MATLIIFLVFILSASQVSIKTEPGVKEETNKAADDNGKQVNTSVELMTSSVVCVLFISLQRCFDPVVNCLSRVGFKSNISG